MSDRHTPEHYARVNRLRANVKAAAENYATAAGIIADPHRHPEWFIGKSLRAARDELAELERMWVYELRLRGFSWAEVGEYLGVTKQAAAKKFAEYCAPALEEW